jgi:CspA family cold shock protein
MRLTGTVKFFNSAKGFGFITPEDGSKDVFVHATAVEQAGLPMLNEGDRVTFTLEDDRKGRRKPDRSPSGLDTEMRRRARPAARSDLAARPERSRNHCNLPRHKGAARHETRLPRLRGALLRPGTGADRLSVVRGALCARRFADGP